MKLFKRPDDRYTEEEYAEMRKKVQDLNLSKKDEWLLIWAAIKTLLPTVLLVLFAIWGIIILFVLIFTQ